MRISDWSSDVCSSDLALVDCLVDVPNAYVAKNRPGCFHPKIFYFETGDKAEAIVGSANFTKGGLGPNFEAGVHAKGAADNPFFVQVRSQIKARSEEHTSELQSLMRISYAVFCLKKKHTN